MKLNFPEAFAFGTSTSAYQIETPFEHDWQNIRSRDGNVFNRTTDHEMRFTEDIDIISSLAPNYRMSMMWSRLQRTPFAKLDLETSCGYHNFLQQLTARGTKIMMVLHHFANPLWFAARDGWNKRENISMWIDYAKKIVDEFGPYVSSWNTFNEPNLYTSMGWIAGEFPPFRKNILAAKKVIQNIAEAHQTIYRYIKEKHPDTPVGISHNCAVFAAENVIGKIPAKMFDLIYMDYAASMFTLADFFGMSYYARISHDPFPITYVLTPEKIKQRGKDHDDMWEYYPVGLKECMYRFWSRYQKPIVITENGICTNDDSKRVSAINDYLKIIHECIAEGMDIRGYYHWSTWDNFEWSLGPSYKFGLYNCDWQTKARTKKPSADLYSQIAFSNVLPASSRVSATW